MKLTPILGLSSTIIIKKNLQSAWPEIRISITVSKGNLQDLSMMVLTVCGLSGTVFFFFFFFFSLAYTIYILLEDTRTARYFISVIDKVYFYKYRCFSLYIKYLGGKFDS